MTPSTSDPIKVQLEGNILWISLFGMIHSSHITSTLHKIEAIEDKLRACPNRILDIRGTTGANLTFDSLSLELGERVKKQYYNAFKVAVLVDTDLQYGFARMYQAIFLREDIPIDIFTDRGKAVAWLESPGTRSS